MAGAKRGRESKYPPEICDLCLELQVTRAWGPVKIAEYLFHEKDIRNEDDPSRPVDRVTVWRWIRKAANRVHKEKVYRDDIEWVKANVTLDDLKRFLYEMRDKGQFLDLGDAFKWFDRALALQREKSVTNNVYPEKRKRVVHEGEVQGIGPKDLDRKREYHQKDFEQWLQTGRSESSFQQWLVETNGEQPISDYENWMAGNGVTSGTLGETP